MVIMAGMLPGVECARRRRLRQGGAAAGAEVGAGTRRPSFCLYAAGHGAHPAAGLAAAGSSGKQRSSVMEMIHGWTLDSNTREAKERLDQKLPSKREATIKRHHSTGSIKLSRPGSTAAAPARRSAAARARHQPRRRRCPACSGRCTRRRA